MSKISESPVELFESIIDRSFWQETISWLRCNDRIPNETYIVWRDDVTFKVRAGVFIGFGDARGYLVVQWFLNSKFHRSNAESVNCQQICVMRPERAARVRAFDHTTNRKTIDDINRRNHEEAERKRIETEKRDRLEAARKQEELENRRRRSELKASYKKNVDNGNDKIVNVIEIKIHHHLLKKKRKN
jgi:hypothetical protein